MLGNGGGGRPDESTTKTLIIHVYRRARSDGSAWRQADWRAGPRFIVAQDQCWADDDQPIISG